MKRGQVWIESVLYTMIGLALIGLVLAFVTPKITEAKDKLAVEQTINSLNDFDIKLNAVLEAPGNRRLIEFTMKRGEFFINPGEGKIVFVISDLKKPYSQPGVDVNVGRIVLRSEEEQKTSSVSLSLSYGGFTDLRYAGGTETKKFTPSSIPYKFSITNEGDNDDNSLPEINIEEISGR